MEWEQLNTIRYYKYLNNLIETRGQWSDDIKNKVFNRHRHHIKLKCFGGLPKRLNWSHNENIIWLTKDEHLKAHIILYEDNLFDYRCKGALNKTQILCNSEVTTVWNKDRKYSKEERLKISISTKKGMEDPEVRYRCGNGNRGRVRPESEKIKISKSELGIKRKKESIEKTKLTKKKLAEQDPNYYDNISKSLRGENNPFFNKATPNSIKIIDSNDNVYRSKQEARNKLGITRKEFNNKLIKGELKLYENKSNKI